jgi:hypothetical protein
MGILSTVQVAREFGVRPDRLNRAIWLGELKPPAKGPGGSFLWGPEDIERARILLIHKGLFPAVKLPDGEIRIKESDLATLIRQGVDHAGQ